MELIYTNFKWHVNRQRQDEEEDKSRTDERVEMDARRGEVLLHFLKERLQNFRDY